MAKQLEISQGNEDKAQNRPEELIKIVDQTRTLNADLFYDVLLSSPVQSEALIVAPPWIDRVLMNQSSTNVCEIDAFVLKGIHREQAAEVLYAKGGASSEWIAYTRTNILKEHIEAVEDLFKYDSDKKFIPDTSDLISLTRMAKLQRRCYEAFVSRYEAEDSRRIDSRYQHLELVEILSEKLITDFPGLLGFGAYQRGVLESLIDVYERGSAHVASEYRISKRELKRISLGARHEIREMFAE